MVNAYDNSPKDELPEAIGATMGKLFASAEKHSTEKGNQILFAFVEERGLAETVG
jgi:hypothetical protein